MVPAERIRIEDALHQVGLATDEIDLVVNCHLHFDHIGGNPSLGGRPIYCQGIELDTARTTDYTAPQLVDFAGARYELLDGEAQIAAGVHVIPTPGHVDGHQSVVFECDDGSIVLAGQSHDTASAWSADALAARAPALGHEQPLPPASPWMSRLLEFDPSGSSSPTTPRSGSREGGPADLIPALRVRHAARTGMLGRMSLDPAVTNPGHYKVVFENDKVRVLEYTDQPGDKTKPHEHPDSVMYTLSSFRRRLVMADMEREVELAAGTVGWLPAQRHHGENIGETPTHAIFVELKPARGREKTSGSEPAAPDARYPVTLAGRQSAALDRRVLAGVVAEPPGRGDVREHHAGAADVADAALNHAVADLAGLHLGDAWAIR